MGAQWLDYKCKILEFCPRSIMQTYTSADDIRFVLCAKNMSYEVNFANLLDLG